MGMIERIAKLRIENSQKEYLSGIIERITYHSIDNGFCVLRVIVKGQKELVTVVGSTPRLLGGEHIKCYGNWHNDKTYGKQFKAEFLGILPPDNLEGIERYLASGLIKGIGKHFANKLVVAFGEKVFEVIENDPKLLSTVEGIGVMRAKSICENWHEQKVIRDIMVFLQSHGVGTTRATRIYKTYGDKAIQVVSENPYLLAKDIRGIGFKSADVIADNLGIAKDSLIRVRAGVNHILLESTSFGHCGLLKDKLIENSQKLLAVENELIEQAIEQEIIDGELVASSLNGKDGIFLFNYFNCEKNIAKLLIRLKQTPASWQIEDIENKLAIIENNKNIELDESQRLAIKQAVASKVVVITGGPGTGKTTLVQTLIAILRTKQLNIKLCAPTGRAAKRLSESSGFLATTIHRLLEIDTAHGGFRRNEKYLLECDYLVIDEASMLDVNLLYAVLRALPHDANLLLVGDIDQLPSVGPGQVLKDIINAKVIPTIQLTKIFRQAITSDIIHFAHLINKGIVPELEHNKENSDFYFIPVAEQKDVIEEIGKLVKGQLPTNLDVNPISDIQVLCPMKKGTLGTISVNSKLQELLNPSSSKISRFGESFAVGDKIMQTENNYNKEVYNGDIGVITLIDTEEQEVTITFDNREIIYDYHDLDQITLAYAITVHKSQGSEYSVIIIPITMQSYIMLRRNLLYTAITRGKKLVIIVGEQQALTRAISNNPDYYRYTKLQEWLVSYAS